MHSILKLSGRYYNQSAWWRVDLGTSYDVSSVLIYNSQYTLGTICHANINMKTYLAMESNGHYISKHHFHATDTQI